MIFSAGTIANQFVSRFQIVFALFWTLFTIDPSTLVPKDRTIFLPAYINHILHTLVGFSPLVNELSTYQARKKNIIFIFLSVFVAYMCQLLIFGLYLDFWVSRLTSERSNYHLKLSNRYLLSISSRSTRSSTN